MPSQWTINRELVEHVVRVARLKLTDEELEKFTSQFRGILEAFKELDDVDTQGVKPSFHPIELSAPLREDKACIWDWDPLENTQHKENKHFKGPSIQ